MIKVTNYVSDIPGIKRSTFIRIGVIVFKFLLILISLTQVN